MPVPSGGEPFSTRIRVILFHVASLTPAVLSLLGTAFFIFTYFFIQRKQAHQGIKRLIFFLVVCDFFISCLWIIENITFFFVHGFTKDHIVPSIPDKDIVCQIIGPVHLFFVFSSLFWTSSFATEMLFKIHNASIDSFGNTTLGSFYPRRREIIYHVLSWGTAFLLILDPVIEQILFVSNLEDNGTTCMFYDSRLRIVLILFGAILLVLFYCIAVYTLITLLYHRKLSLRSYASQRTELRVLMKQISSYLLVFIGCWAWMLVLLIIHITNIFVGDLAFTFAILTAFFVPLNGFLNALIYGFTATIREDIKEYVRGLCSRGQRRNGPEELSINHTRYEEADVASDGDVGERETTTEYF